MPDEIVTPPEQPVVPTDENPPAITPPDYKYEDISKKDMGEIAREEPPKVEEKPVEEPKPEVNVDEVAKKAAESVLAEQEAQRVAQEEAKKAPPPEPTPQEKVYEDWANKFNNENSRQPTYLEAMQFVEEQAISKIEARQQEAYKKYEEDLKLRQDADAEESKKINSYVDDELTDLYTAKILTPIKDPNNPSDQGVIERKSLFTTWAQVNNDRRAKGLPEVISATRIAQFHWKKPNAQPPGANAPVQGSRSSATGNGETQTYTNADLKKPWSWWKKAGS